MITKQLEGLGLVPCWETEGHAYTFVNNEVATVTNADNTIDLCLTKDGTMLKHVPCGDPFSSSVTPAAGGDVILVYYAHGECAYDISKVKSGLSPLKLWDFKWFYTCGVNTAGTHAYLAGAVDEKDRSLQHKIIDVLTGSTICSSPFGWDFTIIGHNWRFDHPSLTWSDDDEYLAMFVHEGDIHVYERTDYVKPKFTIKSISPALHCRVQWIPDAYHCLAVVNPDNVISMCPADGYSGMLRMFEFKGSVIGMEWSPHGTCLAVCVEENDETPAVIHVYKYSDGLESLNYWKNLRHSFPYCRRAMSYSIKMEWHPSETFLSAHCLHGYYNDTEVCKNDHGDVNIWHLTDERAKDGTPSVEPIMSFKSDGFKWSKDGNYAIHDAYNHREGSRRDFRILPWVCPQTATPALKKRKSPSHFQL